MDMNGKNINYFLIDGDVSGRVKCTFSNWTGVAYRIPRTEIEKCYNRDDLNRSGVYMLFGIDDQTGKDVVYIGQAGTRGVLNRLQDHKRNEDENYWSEAIVFTSSNNFLGQTDICYLENRLYNLAVSAKRYDAKNDNIPPQGNLTEEKKSELDDFIEYVKLMVGILGHKVFEPYVERPNIDQGLQVSETTEEILCYSTRGGDFEGKGQQTPDGFVVFRGSRLKPELSDSCPHSARAARERYSAVINEYMLTEDVLLSSPSCAASFLSGISVNGKDVWVNDDGDSLNTIERRGQ